MPGATPREAVAVTVLRRSVRPPDRSSHERERRRGEDAACRRHENREEGVEVRRATDLDRHAEQSQATERHTPRESASRFVTPDPTISPPASRPPRMDPTETHRGVDPTEFADRR